MVKLCEFLPPYDRACLGEFKNALIITSAIRGKRGDAAYAAARRALRKAGVKKPRNVGRLMRIVMGAA